MKTLRKLTALIAVFLLMCTLWVPTTAAAAPQERDVPTDPLYATGELLERLDNGVALRHFYNRIIDGILIGEQYIDLSLEPYSLTPSEALLVEAAVNASIPEGFGDGLGHSYGFLDVSEYGTYFDSYFYNWDLTQEMEQMVTAVVEEWTADLEGKSDFDKSRILYERLVEHNTYDMGIYHQTAYGALIEEMSVCAGYARAYQLLLYEVGIPCLYIQGEADNGWEIGGHAWNLVKLDGKWYYSDPTWDDPVGSDGLLTYSFFNVTYDEISVDHMADASFEPWLPTEPAIDANYYYHEGVVCDSLTVQQMADLFLEHNPLMLYVTGDPQTMIDFFIQHYYEVTDIMGLYSFGFVSCRVAGSHGVSLIIEYDHVHEDTTADGYCDSCNGPIRPKTTPGDLDGNGSVNNRDLGLLQQYINEWAVTINTSAADLNGDGRVNNRDLGLLQRLLNE